MLCEKLHLEKIRAKSNVLIVAKTHDFVKTIGTSHVFISFYINIYAEFNNR